MSDALTIEAGKLAWQRLEGSGKTLFEDWEKAALAVTAIRKDAMRAAKTNKAYGPNYQREVNRLLEEHGFATMAKGERIACYRFVENLQAIRKWRVKLPPDEMRRLNHPDAVFWAWKRSLGFVTRHAMRAEKVNALAKSTPEAAVVPPVRYVDRPRPPAQDVVRRVGNAVGASRCAAPGSDLYGIARVAIEALTRADLIELLGKTAEGKSMEPEGYGQHVYA